MQRHASGKVPTDLGTCPALPLLGRVPSAYSGTSDQTDLCIKATQTGILLLGGYDDQRKKIVPLGRFKKRYTGSKTYQVDIDGNLLSNREYKKVIGNPEQKPKRGKTKKAGTPPCFLDRSFVVNLSSPSMELQGEQGAISEQIATCANIETNIAPETKKKSYTVNKGEVRKRIYGMLNTGKGKQRLFFWTVSFPEGTPDDTCYKAFNTWLTSLRKFGMLKEYLWIAERQLGEKAAPGKEPTLTLHFHIAIPHYMNVYRANSMMRGTLKNLAKGGLMPGAAIHKGTRQVYFLPCIANYNGVDICKHRKTRRPINFAIKKGSKALAHYLTKYVTKNNAGIPNEQGAIEIPAFTHLAWHNSRGFSALFTGVTFTVAEFIEKGFGPFLNRVRIFKMRFAVFVPWLFGPPPLLEDHLYKLNSYIQTLHDGRQGRLHTA